MKRITSFSSIKTEAQNLDDYMVELSRPLDDIMHDISCSDNSDSGSLSDDMSDDDSVLPPSELFNTTFPDEIFDIVEDASDSVEPTSSRLSGDCGAHDAAPRHTIPIQRQERPKKLSLMEQFALSRSPMKAQAGYEYSTPLRSDQPKQKRFDPSLFGSRGSMGPSGSTLKKPSRNRGRQSMPNMKKMMSFESSYQDFQQVRLTPSASKASMMGDSPSMMGNSRSRMSGMMSSMANLTQHYVPNEEKQNGEFDFGSPAVEVNGGFRRTPSLMKNGAVEVNGGLRRTPSLMMNGAVEINGGLRRSPSLMMNGAHRPPVLDNPMAKFMATTGTINVPINFGQHRNLAGSSRGTREQRPSMVR